MASAKRDDSPHSLVTIRDGDTPRAASGSPYSRPLLIAAALAAVIYFIK